MPEKFDTRTIGTFVSRYEMNFIILTTNPYFSVKTSIIHVVFKTCTF